LLSKLDPFFHRSFYYPAGYPGATGIYLSFSYFQIFLNHIHLMRSACISVPVIVFITCVESISIVMFMIVEILLVIIAAAAPCKAVPDPGLIFIGKIVHFFIMWKGGHQIRANVWYHYPFIIPVPLSLTN